MNGEHTSKPAHGTEDPVSKQNDPWDVCTRYGRADLTIHSLVREAYKVACLIERCGASPELTTASSTAFALCESLSEAFVRLTAERDAARLVSSKRLELLKESGLIDLIDSRIEAATGARP